MNRVIQSKNEGRNKLSVRLNERILLVFILSIVFWRISYTYYWQSSLGTLEVYLPKSDWWEVGNNIQMTDYGAALRISKWEKVRGGCEWSQLGNDVRQSSIRRLLQLDLLEKSLSSASAKIKEQSGLPHPLTHHS